MANDEDRRMCTLKGSNFYVFAFWSLDTLWKNKAVWRYGYVIYIYILIDVRSSQIYGHSFWYTF